jgi:murein DD-endopeptidase MepM/ murein hydrolase activator NlpD
MKKYYYFSKKNLKFVEIKNYYRKLVLTVSLVSLVFSMLIFGIYYTVDEMLNPDSAVKTLRSENEELKEKLQAAIGEFQTVNKQLDSISVINNDLRLAANLEPITDEQRNIGIGGNIFEDVDPTNSDEMQSIITTLQKYIDEAQLKIKFEKENYKEIETALSENQKLYDAIPAIKPAEGNYGDRFGIRLHPILKIRRMHNGIDMLSNVGTPVYAPGAGRVEFVGRKGGFGKTIIINHGFGYKTLYGHLSKYKVKRGQKVKRGDLIALTGSSGSLSTGPHLHYEVRHNGIALNPRNFIFDDVNIFDLVKK